MTNTPTCVILKKYLFAGFVERRKYLLQIAQFLCAVDKNEKYTQLNSLTGYQIYQIDNIFYFKGRIYSKSGEYGRGGCRRLKYIVAYPQTADAGPPCCRGS